MKRVGGVAATCAVIVLLAGVVPAAAAPAAVTDITATSVGRDRIARTVKTFTAQGSPVADQDLVAKQYPDGAILVARRGIVVDQASGGSFHASITPPADLPVDSLAPNTISLAAAPYWDPYGQRCFASLFRGVSHMDACYTVYIMRSESMAGTFWRLDWRATMFTESPNRYLRWGWIHADQDAGPTMSWVDWSPDVDWDHACSTFGLSISVAGVGGGFSSTFCEVIDITKTSGTTLGSFKAEWNPGGASPKYGVDRKTAMLLGTKTTASGTPVWGLSWDFSAAGS